LISVGVPLKGGNYFNVESKNKKGRGMLRSNVMKSLAAAALGFLAAYAATAQEAKNLPPGATAHFVYFPTGGYALDRKDQDQIRDVAGMMQSNPDFVATILGKTDSVGSVGFNEHLSQRRANAVFGALAYDNKVSENRLQMCWTGERLPFTSTADQTAEAQNRMAAIVVSKATDAHFCGG
jgi:outer membrane protein OmpA-like peptidoglycan-associated protein